MVGLAKVHPNHTILLYHYTTNNDYTRYNVCSAWFIDTRILCAKIVIGNIRTMYTFYITHHSIVHEYKAL